MLKIRISLVIIFGWKMFKIAPKNISGSQYSGDIKRNSDLSRDSFGSNPFRKYSNSQDFQRPLVKSGFRNQKKLYDEMQGNGIMTTENKCYHSLGGSLRDKSGLHFFGSDKTGGRTTKASSSKGRQTKKVLPNLNGSFMAHISESPTKAGTS
jgi:hypothetical protein